MSSLERRLNKVAKSIGKPNAGSRHVIRFVASGDPLENSRTAPDNVRPGPGLRFERFDRSRGEWVEFDLKQQRK